MFFQYIQDVISRCFILASLSRIQASVCWIYRTFPFSSCLHCLFFSSSCDARARFLMKYFCSFSQHYSYVTTSHWMFSSKLCNKSSQRYNGVHPTYGICLDKSTDSHRGCCQRVGHMICPFPGPQDLQSSKFHLTGLDLRQLCFYMGLQIIQ